MIKSFREVKNAKNKLQSVKPTEAFKCIVESKQNILDFKSLMKFIRQYNPTVSNEDIDVILGHFGVSSMDYNMFLQKLFPKREKT